MAAETVPLRKPEDSHDERVFKPAAALPHISDAGQRRRFGPFEIVRKLGRSMSDVYLARDTRPATLGRLTILKVVEESNDPYTQQVLVAERRGAAIQKQLRDFDPRFVEIYEYGQMDGAFYIAMEYVEGQSVADMLRESGRMDPHSAARIALEICSQLEKLHSHQAEIDGRRRAIVHGDIKPTNIQITATGQTRLLDFGIAKLISLTRNLTHHDLGSPNYCSPERLASAQVDQFADLWATGVTLYEMVTGALPFQGENTRKLENAIRSKRPPRALPSDIPEPIAAIVLKSLAPDIKRRYPTASAFANDLESFLNGRPTVAEREFQTAATNPTIESVRVIDHPPVPPPSISTDSPWQTLLRVRVPKRVGRRGIVWAAVAGSAVVLLAGSGQFYRSRWTEAEPLRKHLELAHMSTAHIDSDWELFERLRTRDAWLGRFSPARVAERNLKAAYLKEGDRIIDSYRKSTGPGTTDFDWTRAQTVFEHAFEIDTADADVQGKLALAKGYVNLNLAIGAQIGVRQHMQDRVIRSWQAFDEAASKLSKSPDPHLGLARLYVYSFRDLDKAIEEWNLAEQRHYKLAPREIEQEADGFRLRAQHEFRELHDRSGAKEDLARAKELYLSIREYSGVTQRLRQAALDESEINPPPAAAPRRAKPAAAKSAKPARRAPTWQSPRAGKHR